MLSLVGCGGETPILSVSAKDLVITSASVSNLGFAAGAGMVAKGLLDANGFDDPEKGVENGFAPAVDAPAPPNRKFPAFTTSFSSFFSSRSSCFLVTGSRDFGVLAHFTPRKVLTVPFFLQHALLLHAHTYRTLSWGVSGMSPFS